MTDQESHHSPQQQDKQPGKESIMRPRPQYEDPDYQGSNKLRDKIAIITGGDSGIGRAIAVAFAIEGCDSVIVYLDEHKDAVETKKIVEAKGRKCITIAGDVGDAHFCQQIVEKTLREFGKINIVINNAAEQHSHKKFEELSNEEMERTFRTNIFAYFYLTKAALPHLKNGSSIINTTSVTAYKGKPELIDYSSTKGAIVAFTRSLSLHLISKGIRVNGVAPGPIWTPLIPASFPAEKVKEFGKEVPMGRPGEPREIAPCYVFLASKDSSYMSGQILHPNGGVIVNG